MTDEEKIKHVLVPEDGDAILDPESKITEKMIHDDRALIELLLHASYVNLDDNMKPFQQSWEEKPIRALKDALLDGAADGVSTWGEDFEDMFTAEFWKEVGKMLGDSAGAVYDIAATHSVSFSDRIMSYFVLNLARAGTMLSGQEDTMPNWRWWQFNAEMLAGAFEEAFDEAVRTYDAAAQRLDEISDAISETAEGAAKLYQYREEILSLPKLFAEGKPEPIQAFVDDVLMKIDPELAQAIKDSPNFYIVLELMADDDSVLMYMTYVSLSIEAMPPNFFAYAAGKGGAYVLLEVILLLASALFTAGTVTAARVGTLLARLAVRTAGAARITKKIQQTQEAFGAFVRTVEDTLNAAERLQALGDKLRIARLKGFVFKGRTQTTIAARRTMVKRKAHCLICGSEKHRTPGGRIGAVLKYDHDQLDSE